MVTTQTLTLALTLLRTAIMDMITTEAQQQLLLQRVMVSVCNPKVFSLVYILIVP